MNKEDYRFWLSIAIGALGLFLSIAEWIRKDYLFALLFILLILMIFAWYRFSLHSNSGIHYETSELHMILDLQDAHGHSAILRRIQKIRARWGNLQGIWWRGIIGDGSLHSFQVDNAAPNKIEKLGTSIGLYKEFKIPLSKGEQHTVSWRCIATDSFPATEEAFLHIAIPGIRNLILEVNFPAQRKCLSAECHEDVGGDATQLLEGVERNQDGSQVKVATRHPRAGHTYRIDWTW